MTDAHSNSLSTFVTEVLQQIDKPGGNGAKTMGNPILNLEAEASWRDVQTPEAGTGDLTIALIDCHRFSQECLINALKRHEPQIKLLPVASVREFSTNGCPNLDLIIYYPHGGDAFEEAIARDLTIMRETAPDIPVIILSDLEEAYQPKAIRSTLSSGAHGFIPTRTTGIPIAIAAIRFVKAGGTFAPLDQLIPSQSPRRSILPDTEPQIPLTSRQMAVLSHLRQGKANKIIAYELNMSESTVKVHVRNIMRRMGASNRTQAAYKAQQLWNRMEFTKASDL